MRRYALIVTGMLAFFFGLFLLSRALGVPLLTDPSPWLGRSGALAAGLGVGLLVADVVLPVPSSLVMVAHGAVFGFAVGALLSVLGSVGATLVGFGLGRRGGPLLARLVTAEERARVDKLLSSYGALAILVTRPVPLLAETTAILAGSSPVGWGAATLAALVGALPPALLYALAGAIARGFGSRLLLFVLVMLTAVLFWVAGRRLGPRLARRRVKVGITPRTN
jgi:uncharacterized membrane protein YdjX (TVP38/TMEM64 family)